MRIGENCIGRRNLLELLLCTRFFVAVRVVLEGERAKGILDLLFGRIACNAKYFVVVAL